MEAVLALSELHGTPLATCCADMLAEYAQAEALLNDEVRQAAIWGSAKMASAATPGCWRSSTRQPKMNSFMQSVHSARTQARP